MVDWLIAIQRWLYGGMAEGMRSTADLSGLPMLMAAAFLFGIVHAFMPGHGKIVLVSYHVGRSGRWLEGVATGALLAITHVGTAILFVLVGVAVISRSLAAGGRAPAFETLSNIDRGHRPLSCCAHVVAPAPSPRSGRQDARLRYRVGALPPDNLYPHLCAREGEARHRLCSGLRDAGRRYRDLGHLCRDGGRGSRAIPAVAVAHGRMASQRRMGT